MKQNMHRKNFELYTIMNIFFWISLIFQNLGEGYTQIQIFDTTQDFSNKAN